MKKVIYLSIIMSLLCWTTNDLIAQKVATNFSKEKAEKMAEIQTTKMAEILDLDASQQSKVYEINYKAAEKILKSQDTEPSQSAYEKKLESVRLGQKKDISKLLNPTQKVKWIEVNEKYQAKKAKENKTDIRN
jgi:hypothetical protein